MMISITAPFLLFPTRRDAPLCKLHFLLAGRKVQEADVRLCAPDDADFVGCMDASAWFRQTLEVLSSDADDALLSGISVSDEPRCTRRMRARCCTSRPRSAGTTTRTV